MTAPCISHSLILTYLHQLVSAVSRISLSKNTKVNNTAFTSKDTPQKIPSAVYHIMIKSFPKSEESDCRDSGDSDKNRLGNLDLLNLRFNFSSGEFTNRRGRSPVLSPKPRKSERGSGDSYTTRHHHPLEKSDNRRLVPNIGKLPKGYDNNRLYPPSTPSENFVLLYTKERNSEYVFTDPVDKKDFLFPSKKKTRPKITNVSVEDRMFKNPSSRTGKINSGSFPFQQTPSGNLKVQTSQVVFSSNKLSVLVADPKNTKVNIEPKPSPRKMAHDADFSKTSAMDTIISQAGFSSLGTLIGNTPVRSGNKEDSEYESKQTSEILDPELNLGRLGYNGTQNISWEKVNLPEKKNLYLELYSRITNYTNADCKVYIDNEEFNCHLIVLQCYSELFDAYIAVKKVELPSDKCSAASFAFIYEWMITGEPSYKELNRSNVLDIFCSAKYLKIKDLIEQCWAFIDHGDVFSEDTAFLLYMDAKDRNLPEVKELMLPRIQGFLLMLVSSQNWLELDLEDVKNFLRSNYICVNCEMEIFMSAVRWLKHDWSTRDRYKYEILECVRFGNIAPWQLVDIKRNPENPDFMELAKDPRICKMIDDGLAYVIIKYWYGQDNDDFQHWNAVLGLQEPPPRNWSGSDKTYFTYREFLIYLDQYRRNQLLEKNNFKPANDPKGDVIREPKKIPTLTETRVPTMEEFLSKKKIVEILPSPRDIQVYRTHHLPKVKFKIVKRRISRTQAAIVIQRAYRKYKQAKLIRNGFLNCVTDSEIPNNLKKKNGVFGLFSSQKNMNSIKVQTNYPGSSSTQADKEPDETSLFNKTRETILLFGGTDPHQEYGSGRNTGNDIIQYIPERNAWEFVGKLPEPRHYHCTVFFKGRIWVVGGADPRNDEVSGNLALVSGVWSFDPRNRNWFQEESLIEPRKNFGLISCNKYMYAIGGQGINYEALRSVEKYNSQDRSWQQAPPMNHFRIGLGCVFFNKAIFVAGGLSGTSKKLNVLNSVETFDIRTNQWTEIAYPLRFPRCFPQMMVISDKMYIVGGAGRSTVIEKLTTSIGAVDIWNDKQFHWENVTELNIPRHGHSLAYLGTQLIVLGGVSTLYSRALSNTECFCTLRNAWIRGMANIPTALAGHSTVTLPPLSLIS